MRCNGMIARHTTDLRDKYDLFVVMICAAKHLPHALQVKAGHLFQRQAMGFNGDHFHQPVSLKGLQLAAPVHPAFAYGNALL